MFTLKLYNADKQKLKGRAFFILISALPLWPCLWRPSLDFLVLWSGAQAVYTPCYAQRGRNPVHVVYKDPPRMLHFRCAEWEIHWVLCWHAASWASCHTLSAVLMIDYCYAFDQKQCESMELLLPADAFFSRHVPSWNQSQVTHI